MNVKTENLFIRVDAGIQIGDGHFSRCLTLADNLKAKSVLGWKPTGDLPTWIKKYKQTLKI